MCGSITLASAADIYLASTGADTNDGLTPGTAVKTLSKAFTICLEGDVIHVMDMININEEPKKSTGRTDIDLEGDDALKVLTENGVTYTTWNAGNGTVGIIPHTRSITVVGDDKASCGFDGNGTSTIIRQDQSSGTHSTTYKNLTFKNGKTTDNSGGGAVYVRQSGWSTTSIVVNFENCDFINNSSKTDKPGGAVSILPAAVNFKHCRFAENIASKGAGLYVERGLVTLDSCVFEDHDLTVESASLTAAAIPNSNGAALMVNLLSSGQTLQLDVKNTLFKNNKATNGGAFSTGESNAITAGSTNVKFTNCAFVGNSAVTGTGGAAFINNIYTGPTADFYFVNTTFNDNLSGTNNGGALFAKSIITGSLNLINCTVSGNKVAGTTGAGGAGVRFGMGSATATRKILNTILENNTAVDANSASAVDYADLGMENIVDPTTLAETPSYVAGTTLIIEKSLIGKCDNPDFSTQFPNNLSNYVFELNGSIVNSYKAKLGEFDEEENYFPLLAGSEAIGYGNSSYLVYLTPSVTTDQIGRNRPATTCSAGAYEYETVSGVKRIENSSIVVFRNANNQIVVNNASETAGAGTITVCNMMGQVVAKAAMTGSTTTMNATMNAGTYVVIVNADGKISTQKVVF